MNQTTARAREGLVEHRVASIRATGRTEEVVAADLAVLLGDAHSQGWALQTTVPFVYNSAATGYLLVFLRREAGSIGGDGG